MRVVSKSKSKSFNKLSTEFEKKRRYGKYPRFRLHQFFLRYAEIFFTQIYKDLYGDAMLVPIQISINMAAWQKHLSLSSATKAYYVSLKELKNIKTVLFFLYKFPEISHFLKLFWPSCKCDVIQKLRNSKPRTRSEQKFV